MRMEITGNVNLAGAVLGTALALFSATSSTVVHWLFLLLRHHFLSLFDSEVDC